MLITSIVAVSSACEFDGLLASCPMTLGGHHVQVSARINHCHTPIDVTFLVQATNDRTRSANNTQDNLRHRPLFWHYTYVTTNHPESRDLPGYGRRIMLHMLASTRTELGGHAQRMNLKAQFLVDGQTNAGLTFVDDNVRIPHFDDCQYVQEEDKIGNIALGCIVTVILLCFVGLAGLWLFRPKKASEDELDLVGHMERNQSSPSRRRQIDSHPVDIVHYVVPKPNDQEHSKEEIKVYVSTSNGLKKVERRPSQNSDRSSSSTSKSSSTSQEHNNPEKRHNLPHPLAPDEDVMSSSDTSSQDSYNPDRSLGAIPKRRNSNAPGSSSSSSGSSSPSR